MNSRSGLLRYGLAASLLVLLAACSDTPDFGSVMSNDTKPKKEPAPSSATASPAKPAPAAQPRPSAQPQQQAAAKPAVNVIPQAMQQKGVVKCAPRVKQITDFVTNNAQYGGQAFTSPSAPDKKIASIVLEVQSGNKVSLVDAGFIPGQGPNECGGLYEAVNYWDKSCEAVEAQSFSKFKRAKPLRSAILTLENANLKVFLMPAANGCVSIMKEVIYN
jgi:hypothetical protein